MPTTVNGVPVGDAATIDGANITVSWHRNHPAVLKARADQSIQDQYWAHLFLPNIGTTSGGVITSELWTPEMALADRKPEALAPGAEIPLAGTKAGEPIIAYAEFSGLGYEITEEMELRNQLWLLEQKEIAHGNTIANDLNAKAIGVLKKAVADHNRGFVVPTPWNEIVVDGAAPTPTEERPHHTLSRLRALSFQQRVPFKLSTMVAHADDLVELDRIYPNDGIEVDAVSSSKTLQLKSIIPDTTGDVERGKPILGAEGGIGGTAWERGLKTEFDDSERKKRRRDLVLSSASAAYIVNNGYGVRQLEEVAS